MPGAITRANQAMVGNPATTPRQELGVVSPLPDHTYPNSPLLPSFWSKYIAFQITENEHPCGATERSLTDLEAVRRRVRQRAISCLQRVGPGRIDYQATERRHAARSRRRADPLANVPLLSFKVTVELLLVTTLP